MSRPSTTRRHAQPREAGRREAGRESQHQGNSGLSRKTMRPAEHPLWYDICLGALVRTRFPSSFWCLVTLPGVMTACSQLRFLSPRRGGGACYTLHCIFSPWFGGCPAVKAAAGAALAAARTDPGGPFLQPRSSPCQPLPPSACPFELGEISSLRGSLIISQPGEGPRASLCSLPGEENTTWMRSPLCNDANYRSYIKTIPTRSLP